MIRLFGEFDRDHSSGIVFLLFLVFKEKCFLSSTERFSFRRIFQGIHLSYIVVGTVITCLFTMFEDSFNSFISVDYVPEI